MSLTVEEQRADPARLTVGSGWRTGVAYAGAAGVVVFAALHTGAAQSLAAGIVLGLAGTIVVALATPLLAAAMERRRSARILSSVESDPAPHFLTHENGRALGHTAPAFLLSHEGEPPDLAAWLAPYVVSPDATLSQIRREASMSGCGVFTLRTEAHCTKIVARKVSSGLILWRVERLADFPDTSADSGTIASLTRGDAMLALDAPGSMSCLEESLPVALARIAGDGSILSANAAARALLALEEGSLPPFYDLVEGMGRPVAHWLRDAIDGHGLNKSEILRASVGGSELYLQVTLARIESDSAPLLLATFHDATELKSLEAQFVQSQKMQAIGQLAGGVAHDFNNLLTAISGHCDLLLLRHDAADPDYSDLMQISQNANRAASLVGQLLAFSRKQTMKAQVMDLADAMSDLTHLLNRLVGEKISLDLNVAPLSKVIRADRRQFEQVVMNLVVNARDAMPDGGTIRIDVSETRLEAPMMRDRVQLPGGDYITIRVKDEGVGISADALPKIFEPFYTTKKTGEGTGLGLSTAYGIVKQSGGYIFAESASGKGSSFSLFFPATDRPLSENTAPPSARTKTSAPQGEGVVLLVEDEAPVRAFAARALRMKGYTVIEAEDAEQALSRLSDRALTVDLFVTDVIMPGQDGPSWVREALQDRPDTRVVFVSGYAEESLAENQARVPNSVFLPKPFSLSELTTVVHQQLTA